MTPIDRCLRLLPTQAAFLGAIAAVTWPSLTTAQLRTERRVVGDTMVVRTIGVEPATATRRLQRDFSFGTLDGPAEYVFGSISGIRIGNDGSVFVFDRSIPMLRQYDSTGKYVRSIGRGGQGPGEYGQGVGISLAPNGNVYLLNRAANRVSVYGPSGAHVTDWRIPAERGISLFPSLTGLAVDTTGTIHVRAPIADAPSESFSPLSRSIPGIVRYRPDGTVRDTLRVPNLGFTPTPMLRARTRGMGLAYTPDESWVFSRLGHFVGGRSDRNEIHVVSANGKVIRIERDTPRIPISPAQRDAIRERITRTLRAYDPLWTWNGPEVPRVKPYFGSVRTDDDGRIWVQRHVPSERVPEAEQRANAATARGRAGEPVLTDIPAFREPVLLYEVFAPDGRYLGRVELLQFTYVPTIKGNAVWAGTLDADGAPVVTRFRIEPPLPRG